jgi:hypothetical protein
MEHKSGFFGFACFLHSFLYDFYQKSEQKTKGTKQTTSRIKKEASQL